MDQYIRDFQADTVDTYTLKNCYEAETILRVNNKIRNFKILHNNIRSLNKNIDEFKILIENMKVDIDCLVLTETWKLQDPDLFQIFDYDMLYNFGDLNQNDGVMVYIKSNLKYKYEIKVINNIKLLEIKINPKNTNESIIISAVYRSPSTDISEFNRHLHSYLESIDIKRNNYNILIGDMNINILEKDEPTNEYLNILNEFGFVSMVNIPTRVQGNSRTCIDHIFVKSKNNNIDNLLPLVIQTCITDHYTTVLQIISNDTVSKNIDNALYKSVTNFNNLKARFRNVCWDQVYSENDIEAATKKFVEITKDIVEECSETVKIKRKYHKKAPWMTNAILTSVNRKNEIFRKICKQPNNLEMQQTYKLYKNKLTALIKKTKQNYYENLINGYQYNSKQLWKVVQDITKTKKMNNEITLLTNAADQKITELKEIANEFNDTFSNMGKKLAQNIKLDKNIPFEQFRSLKSFVMLDTDYQEINSIINELKNNKSPGCDGLKSETVKCISDYIIEPLVFIINRCMSLGHWPSVFKDTIVIPIFKKGDNTIPSNYRPISLTTNFTKIFEKVLKNRLQSYLKHNKILSDRQFGFRENLSTQDAILCLTKSVYSALDKSLPCLCLFIDLAKAFDTVSHPLLLKSLEDIGIRGNCLRLFSSYISNRTQCVKVSNILSEKSIIEYGVPQGTVLGPILFSIYINNLFNIGSSGEIIGFADDTAIFYQAPTWTELQTKVAKDITYVKHWFDQRLLTINLEKTQYLPFSCNISNLPHFTYVDIKVGGSIHHIQQVKSVKYLGIFIDRHMRWDVHIQHVVKNLQFILYKFRYLTNILPQDALKTIYYALVESHIKYGILVWGAAVRRHLSSLEILQRRFLKLMLRKSKDYSTELTYAEAEVFDLRQEFYYKSVVNYRKEKINDHHSHKHNTRQKNLQTVPFMTKSIGQRSYDYLAPKLFNTLPEELKILSGNLFKNKLKTFLKLTPRAVIHGFIEK